MHENSGWNGTLAMVQDFPVIDLSLAHASRVFRAKLTYENEKVAPAMKMI